MHLHTFMFRRNSFEFYSFRTSEMKLESVQLGDEKKTTKLIDYKIQEIRYIFKSYIIWFNSSLIHSNKSVKRF